MRLREGSQKKATEFGSKTCWCPGSVILAQQWTENWAVRRKQMEREEMETEDVRREKFKDPRQKTRT